MLDADEGPLAAARLAYDERGLRAGPEGARCGLGGAEPVGAPARGGLERGVLAGLARDRAELAQFGDEAIAVLREVAVERVGHALSIASACAIRAGGRARRAGRPR